MGSIALVGVIWHRRDFSIRRKYLECLLRPCKSLGRDQLNDLAVFVRVAQFESFSRAAHALGMPVSTVSRKVTALEERLGVTLLQRTTRKLRLIAQRIGKSVRYVVASPEYLQGRLPPSRPEDLRQHQCVLLQGRNNEAEWHLVSDKKSIKLHVTGPVAARDFQAVSAFTYRGHGIGLLPSTYCDAQIARGELVRLLPGWSSPEIFVHAVYPTRRFLPAKLQVFLEHLKAWKSPLWIPLR